MDKTFFFYDLETSGLKPRADRIMQFAGQRTTMDLEPLGDPVNILVKITDDALPSPSAIEVTGITPQQTLMDGISEAEFCKYAQEEIFTPGTIAVGYNSVRFDDEFMRATMWRNFYDPYEWEWKDERSRWDILDVVRLVRALRPEGIEWPFNDKGAPTNRLELLTKLNGLEHAHAHDALSDVYATIAVAQLVKSRQPKMFKYLLGMRNKREVAKLVNLSDKIPFVYASGRYSNQHNKTTVAFPLTAGRNGNVVVYDLRYDLEQLLSEDEPQLFPAVKELCYNKCPAVAPIGVLDINDGWNKIGLSREQVEQNLSTLLRHPEFAEQMRSKYEEQPEWPAAPEPEMALYDGFLDDADRVKVSAVHQLDAERLADYHPDFADERLPDLLLHYKGRNFPESLSESEMSIYESYRQARLKRQAPEFLKELEGIKDNFIKEELMLYMQSLV